MFRRCAAASPYDPSARAHVFFAVRGEFLGADRIISVGIGKSGVGLDYYRFVREKNELFDYRHKLVGTERTVDSDSVGKRRRGQGERCDVAPGKRTHIVEEGHRRDHRKIGVFLYREQSRAQFRKIGHRFDEDEIRSVGGEYGALIYVVRRIERHRAERFDKLSRRTEIERDESVFRRGSRYFYRGAYQIVGYIARFGGVGSEGRGGYHVGARFRVFAVYPCDDVGTGQIEFFGQSTRARVSALKSGAERAVEHDDIVAHEFAEIFHFCSDPRAAQVLFAHRAHLSLFVNGKGLPPSLTPIRAVTDLRGTRDPPESTHTPIAVSVRSSAHMVLCDESGKSP